MRTLLALSFCLILVASCQEQKQAEPQEVRYTQQSAEIDSYKAGIRAYEKGDWDGYRATYSDTVKIYRNNPDKAYNTDETVAMFTEQQATFSQYGFNSDDEEFEMVKTDDGNTWVNYWGLWKATIAANGQEVKVPVHLTAQFVDGKIVREYGYWDGSIVQNAMEALAAEAEGGQEEGAEE